MSFCENIQAIQLSSKQNNAGKIVNQFKNERLPDKIKII
jgi:hypothetical protein